MNYFDKIPLISYGGRVAKNITSKAQLSPETRANKFNFYPYTMGTERSDTLSNKYYDNPGYSWLIWMTNDVIDPYFEMPLSDDDFNNHIISKYGTLQVAQRKIKCWRSNWHSDETRLTPSQYQLLPSSHKKYYDPVLTNYLQTSEYKRKPESTLINSNMIVEVVLTEGFVVGEELTTVGGSYANVAAVDGSIVVLDKVIGSFSVSDIVTGSQSGTTSTISSLVLLSESVAFTDASFWSPVTFYDYEKDLNEGRKNIYLLDNRLKGQADTELKRVMST